MAAPKNNQYWKMRSKHGRDSIIQDAETLAKASDEYFQYCMENPIIEIDYRGKPLQRVELEHPKPFLKGEFARFCGLAQWRSIEELKEKGEDFTQIITYIEGIIRDQKYKYAVVGMYNSNIVARDLGLKDRQDHTSNDQTFNGSIIINSEGESPDVE